MTDCSWPLPSPSGAPHTNNKSKHAALSRSQTIWKELLQVKGGKSPKIGQNDFVEGKEHLYTLCSLLYYLPLSRKKNQVISGVRKVSKHTSWPWGKTEARSQHVSAMRHGRRNKNRVKNRMKFIQQLKVSKGKEVSMTPDRLLQIWTSSMTKNKLGEQVWWYEINVSHI